MTPARLGSSTANEQASWVPPPVTRPPTAETVAGVQDVSIPPGETDLPAPSAEDVHSDEPTQDAASTESDNQEVSPQDAGSPAVVELVPHRPESPEDVAPAAPPSAPPATTSADQPSGNVF